MFSWLEQRVKLKDFFTSPLFPRGITSWSYFPGAFAVILLIFQLISGLVLAFTYVPEEISGGRILAIFWQNAHWLGANLLLIATFLHFLRNLYHGTYRQPREFIWFSGMVLFLIIVMAFVTGQILPYTLQAKETIIFSKQLADKIPVAGTWIIDLFWLNAKNPVDTLRRCYFLHVSSLPLAIILLLIAHFWFMQRAGIAADSKK